MGNQDPSDRLIRTKRWAKRIAEVWIFGMPIVVLAYLWIERSKVTSYPCISTGIVEVRSKSKYGTGYSYKFRDEYGEGYNSDAYVLVVKGRKVFEDGGTYLVVYHCDNPNRSRLLPVPIDTSIISLDSLIGSDGSPYVDYPMY